MKQIKIIRADDLIESVKSVPFTERFLPIEATSKIRTVSKEKDNIKSFQ